MKLFIEKFKLSIIATTFGARIKEEEIGKSMKYLMIVMLIIGSAMMIKIEFVFNNQMNDFVSNLKTEYPNFELNDGRFICDGVMPFIKIKNDAIFVIDTSGKTDSEVLNNYKSGAIITETNLVYKQNTIETKTYNFSDTKGFNITKARVIEILKSMRIPGLIILFTLGVIFIYATKLLGVLLLSILALIVSKISKVNIAFQDLYKISIYAIILPSIIKASLSILDINIPYFFVLYYGLALFFIIRYIKSFYSEKDKNSGRI